MLYRVTCLWQSTWLKKEENKEEKCEEHKTNFEGVYLGRFNSNLEWEVPYPKEVHSKKKVN